MRYMWRKLWHDLWQGWKNTCFNVFIVTLGNGIWLGILNEAPEVTVGIFILGFTLLVAWAAPLQMDKAMHLCPMDRREKRRYLLRYYWLRVGVCFGLSAPAHLAMAAVGWQSLPVAGLEVLLLAVYSLTALSANLPERPQGKAKTGVGAVRTGLWLNRADIGTLFLYFVVMVLILLLHYIQRDFWEQEIFEAAALGMGGIVLVSAFVYVVRVLPRTLAECSDYESSCKYFRAE